MPDISIEPILSMDYKTIEEIKKLRTNVSFLNVKVISVTSVVGKEGKTMISFWLAKTLASTGKRVILVDGNLRSKHKDSIFHINKNIDKKKDLNAQIPEQEQLIGLVEYLNNEANIQDIIYRSNFDLDLILSGNVANNPSELLSYPSVDELFQYLRDNYDYVIVDTPAAGEVTDATIMSEYSDGCLLVMEPHVTDGKFAMKVKEQIENSGSKVLGAVINKA